MRWSMGWVMGLLLVLPSGAEAGDILRGGVSASSTARKAREANLRAGDEAAAAAQAQARDRLAQTTRAVESVKAMQQAARSRASGVVVPNGLTPGGLQVLTGSGARWSGAEAPVSSGNVVRVQQTESQAVLHWETFNVGGKTTLRFDQSRGGADASKWVAFNKVSDPSGAPSRILGRIEADGQVYVINQNGIVFGAGSQVNARSLVASALPINDNLISRGLLNNPDAQFLFSANSIPAGAKGTPAFAPPPSFRSDGRVGDVVVEPGATISTPSSADGNGGRVFLVGANVRQGGRIVTPSGQAILAAGLEVGIDSHRTSDPSLRGLDVYVGAVGGYGGLAENTGIIESPRGNIWITGRRIVQAGVLDSTTSVSLNGRIDLVSNFDATPNTGYDPSIASRAIPFLYRSTGVVELAPGSVQRILPEASASSRLAGELPLRSRIFVQGGTVEMGAGAMLLAPNADVSIRAGRWGFVGGSLPSSQFIAAGGSVRLAGGAWIDVAGSVGAIAGIEQNLLTLELRGAELADSPLQRTGPVRGTAITVDLRRTGTYGGRPWVGTPLGDVSGFAALVERDVTQLTTDGGTVDIRAGEAIRLEAGSTIDVSGGWTRFEGGRVETTRLVRGGRLVDIAEATPDQIYDGIFLPESQRVDRKWGILTRFALPLAPTGGYSQTAYVQGADAGRVSLAAPRVELGGSLVAETVVGPRQLRRSETLSEMPGRGSFEVAFRAQDPVGPLFLTTFPNPPSVTIGGGISAAGGHSFILDVNRLSAGGFGSFKLNNEDGEVAVPSRLELPAGSILDVTAANIRVLEGIRAPGGQLRFRALNISPFLAAQRASDPVPTVPEPASGRGIFWLAPGAALSTAGLVQDGRETGALEPWAPIFRHGGVVAVDAYSIELGGDSVVDVSGGLTISRSGVAVYGDAGSIILRAGNDPDLRSVLGGRIELGGRLLGLGGRAGGSLTLQAGRVVVGQDWSDGGTLGLRPDFFQTGGFARYEIIGLGAPGVEEDPLPAIDILAGTRLEPRVGHLTARFSPTGAVLLPLQKPVGVREAAELIFSAPGVRDAFSNGLVVRGDLVLREGVDLATDPGGRITLSGNTVTVLGSVRAPGGEIVVRGANDSSSVFLDQSQPLVTVYLGASSILSAAGTFVRTPDPFGRLTGSVWGGGTVRVAGNIAANRGSRIDVSGIQTEVDVAPWEWNPDLALPVDGRSGLVEPPAAIAGVRVPVASNGGRIELAGGQLLASHAVLLGAAGGPGADGGTLSVSSGRFQAPGTQADPSQVTLSVGDRVSPPPVPSGVGRPVIADGGGVFDLGQFRTGGFDELHLGGVVEFLGRIDLSARRALRVADGGFLYASSDVRLSAPRVSLGMPLMVPVRPEDRVPPFNQGGSALYFAPEAGPGRLNVEARLIEVGNLSLRGIGETTLEARDGDIRGSGTLALAGLLTLRAGQVYPTTAAEFTIVAYDSVEGPGTIRVEGAGQRPLPLSAGGRLALFGTVIEQGGVLRAPLGEIRLGWDGTGTAPSDPLTGTTLPFPVTERLSLLPGSVTSVTAVDPASGKALLIPYGFSPDGERWIDPRGVDITTTGAPAKGVVLSAGELTFDPGALIDVRGGGDLYAFRWVEGNGGRRDVLAEENSFAILPDYGAEFAPFSPFNPSSNVTNEIRGVSGYSNESLQPGARIYLAAGSSLPAGVYTLLPARYALLPGAFLVTPQAGRFRGPQAFADGSSVVAGYRFQSFDGRRPGPLAGRFEVASADVVRARATYEDYLGDAFFLRRGNDLGTGRPRLSADSGHLVFQATGGIQMWGGVLSSAAPGGRGAAVDISSDLDIFVGGTRLDDPGVVFLHTGILNRFGARSLLIGGTRQQNAGRTSLDVRSTNVIVQGGGEALTGADIALAARASVTAEAGARIRAEGAGAADSLSVAGNGSLIRVSSDQKAETVRTLSGTPGAASLEIGNGAVLSGGQLVVDTTGSAQIAPGAQLRASRYGFSGGRVALQLDPQVTVPAGGGLTLSTAFLSSIDGDLSLTSYSSLDFHGGGVLSGLGRLSLNAGSIRGIQAGGRAIVVEAREVLLGNAGNVTGPVGGASSGGTIEFRSERISLTPGQLRVGPFQRVGLTASHEVAGSGQGSLVATGGNLVIQTPLLTGSAGSERGLSAAGAFRLEGTPGVVQPGTGLGGRLNIEGAEVFLGSSVALASGRISVRATGGDLLVGGTLDVSGFEKNFYDQPRATPGGEILLSATSGSVRLLDGSRVDVSAPSTGDAGNLEVFAPGGVFRSEGVLRAAGGRGGGFRLDVRELAGTAGLAERLGLGGFTRRVDLRVRTGNVLVDGAWRAEDFQLAADSGSIRVTGLINASGTTGGGIFLRAHRDLIVEGGSRMDVSATAFSHAGKGGTMTLEVGAPKNGIAGDGAVVIRAGATLDFRVADYVAGPESQLGTSASAGRLTGKLHIRAPQTTTFDDVRVAELAGDFLNPSLIMVEGFRIYDLTSSGGNITNAVQNAILADGRAFFSDGVILPPGQVTNEQRMRDRLLAGQPSLDSRLVLVPGAEVINRSGDLTLGSPTSTTASDWDLSGFRFGSRGAPGVLTLKADRNIVFFNALSDGFTPTAALGDPTRTWLSRLTIQNPLLPVNAQSWSYRITAGADFSAAAFSATRTDGVGDLSLGKIGGSEGNNVVTGGANALTSSVVNQRYQVIRTGSGDIRIQTGGNVRLLNHLAAIYTAGTRVADATFGGAFDLPVLSQAGQIPVLGAVQQNYPALFSLSGGDVSIQARGEIARMTRNGAGQMVDDSTRQLPNNWLYRRGFVDPVTGEFGTGRFNDVATTAWWVDFSNFFQSVGALGGGNVRLEAGGRIANVDAVVPTNARMLKSGAGLIELGGGDLEVRAGGDLDAGVYYVERGRGNLRAGGRIVTNSTRSPSTTNLTSQNIVEDSSTWLPTTLFVGKGRFEVSGLGDVLLGPVANPFLLPVGLGNSYWYKTYFSSYSADSGLRVDSIGGDLTLRQSAYLDGSVAPLLQIWARRHQLLSTSSSAFHQPWLRLAEETDQPFRVSSGLLPPRVEAVAFSGDIALGGALTLSPAARGSLDLLASGSIAGLRPAGRVDSTVRWTPAWVNVSDSDPGAIPGVARPFGYQTIAGTSQGAALTTQPDFLFFLNALFAETGATSGSEAVLQRKQSRHAPGLLHAGDPEPVRLFAGAGDISGVTLFSPKFTEVRAGRDIADVAFYIQNLSSSDTSVVQSGRDILLFNANSPLRGAANAAGNLPVEGGGPLAGDVQISGPGLLVVNAGRTIDLGTGDGGADGTGAGITSVGNARNPYLPFGGAEILLAAGLRLDDVPWEDLGAEGEDRRAAVQAFFDVLRDAGRQAALNPTRGYNAAFSIIGQLFQPSTGGGILARSRDVRTRNGGDISVFIPRGGLSLASSSLSQSLTPPGIITESGGNISIFADRDVDIGIGRIFTLRGGDILIWSSRGNIAAGAAAKTVQSAPPTRVLLDPQSAAVQTDLAGLATGGGIGVLATVADTSPGDVDLVAPSGVVDAGDAGIRVTGNLNIAATEVRNAGNIRVGGASAGVPSAAPAAAAVRVAAPASSSAAAAASASAQEIAAQVSNNPAPTVETPSLISVEVLGYGGPAVEEDEDIPAT